MVLGGPPFKTEPFTASENVNVSIPQPAWCKELNWAESGPWEVIQDPLGRLGKNDLRWMVPPNDVNLGLSTLRIL